MNKTLLRARALLLNLLGNPGVFALTAFTVTGMFSFGALAAYRGVIELNVLVPWGVALALLQLDRRLARGEAPIRWDIAVLFALYLWLLVPFMARFGPTTNNIATWHNHLIVFFGVYALSSSADTPLLERQLDVTAALASCVSLVFCGSLLYCAAMGVGENDPSSFPYGVFMQAHLTSASHYNTTGMLAMCLSFLCLVGVCRGKARAGRALHLLAAVMAMLVTVLSQSRTARYSLLIGLAAGAYGAVVACGRIGRRALVRHAAGVLAGALVLAGGYLAANGVTHAALAHYARLNVGQSQARTPLAAPALAEEEAAPQPTYRPVLENEQRSAGDSSFTGRTDVWKNIFRLWKENPKYFLMGYGMGRNPRTILVGTPLEGIGANSAHNTYIQFALDYGIVGFALLCAFFLMILAPVLRAFYAPQAMPGSRALCMLIIGCLMTGMMESDPLGAMRPCNLALFYALGCAVQAGRRLGRA